MLDRINLNDELNNNKSLNEQIGVSGVVTNPIHSPYKNIDKNLLIDETAISDEAVILYEKEQDIQKFNSLAMSNPDDLTHEEIVEGLFSKGITDPFSNEVIGAVASNKQLIEDLSAEFE